MCDIFVENHIAVESFVKYETKVTNDRIYIQLFVSFNGNFETFFLATKSFFLSILPFFSDGHLGYNVHCTCKQPMLQQHVHVVVDLDVCCAFPTTTKCEIVLC